MADKKESKKDDKKESKKSTKDEVKEVAPKEADAPKADAPKDGDKAVQKQIAVNAQYVKDLSFENPKAPESLVGKQERPNIDINVDINVNKMNETLFEVILSITATAKRGSDTVFIAEIKYAGMFSILGISDQELEPALMVFCPTLLFPYARRILSDLTRDGGFPPLMMDPIDFAGLYMKRKQEMSKEAEAS